MSVAPVELSLFRAFMAASATRSRGRHMNKGLTITTGQTHVNRWTDDVLKMIQAGTIDPSFVITHTVASKEGPDYYKTFRDKHDGCIKVVLKPELHA